jgi:hypothetical protein
MEVAARDLSFRVRGRRELSLAVLLRVQDADAPRVRYTRAALTAQGEIAGTTVDLSEGGIGIIVDTYLPKWCRVWVRIPSPIEGRAPLLAIAGFVHRCVMCDRRPAYLLGIGFSDLSAAELGALRALLAASDDASVPAEATC